MVYALAHFIRGKEDKKKKDCIKIHSIVVHKQIQTQGALFLHRYLHTIEACGVLHFEVAIYHSHQGSFLSVNYLSKQFTSHRGYTSH